MLHVFQFLVRRSRSAEQNLLINRRRHHWCNTECRAAKDEFLKAKKQFRFSANEANKLALLDARKRFNLVKKRAKRHYNHTESKQMTHLSKSAPKQFWRHLNSYRKGKKVATQDVTLEDFAEHFKNLSNNKNSQQNSDSSDFENQNIDVEELDRPIFLSEIRYAISTLKRGKSPGFDGLLSNFFIDAKDFIASFLLKMYTVIFESAMYPESWTKGLIVPIHRKGDKGDPNNYRGITLISTFAKIFSLVLQNRLNSWCEANDIFNDFQFGFRNQRITSDCIFILHSLIQKVLKQNSKMYCAFVDYEKAFHTVVRDALWFKLIDSGVSSKMVKMIKSLYSKVLAAVKLQTDVSTFF